MPTLIACPSCQKPLNVPDNLLGKQVKCPACTTVFTAQAAPPPIPTVIPTVEPIQEPPPPPPPPLSQPPPPLPPPPAFRDRREWAASQVMGPAIGLMVTGGVGILANLTSLARLIMLANTLQGPGVIIGGMIITAGFLCCTRMIVGGNSMRSLENYQSAYVACIVAMVNLPMCCFLLGMGFGIWGVVVLNNPEVRAEFRSIRSQRRPPTPPEFG